MVYKDQIPWFATSNGVIDLKTSADFRENRYTNNEIVSSNNNNNNNSNNYETNIEKKSSNGSAKSQSKMMNKVMLGGLPPLPHDKPRPITGPPPPKENELYGDILVIPPIRHQLTQDDDPPPVYTRFIQVQENIRCMQSTGWRIGKPFILMLLPCVFSNYDSRKV